MKVVIQRVLEARCIVDNQEVSKINHGLMLLVGFSKTDTSDIIDKMVNKIVNLRIFEDENQKMNLSIQKVDGEILSISQFTLYANPYEGNRPSFVDAMEPVSANMLYQKFNEALSIKLGKTVKPGVFGADMKLKIICDGPVTITLEY